jgi:hypothetical protein
LAPHAGAASPTAGLHGPRKDDGTITVTAAAATLASDALAAGKP